MKLIIKYLLIVNCFLIVNLSYADPYGTALGSYNNITNYSNGNGGYVSNEYNFVNGTNTGMKWQCVEYVNRYYLVFYNQNIRIAGQNAVDYYPTAGNRGLVSYPNGGTISPALGDLLCFSGGNPDYGHVAIIREIGSNYLKVIQQNVSQSSSDANYTVNMTISGGHYTVSGSTIGSGYVCQGWLRKPLTTGYAKVSQGLNVIPNPVISGGSLQVTFTLTEIQNAPITIDSITCAVLDNNNVFKFNLTRFSNITINANGSWNYASSGGYFSSSFALGTYKAIARGFKDGIGWFDFTVTGNGVNPKSFQVIAPTGLNNITEFIPNKFSLSQNYPNPFNPVTQIQFNIPQKSFSKLTLYDIEGNVVTVLVEKELEAGSYQYTFDGFALSSGVYFYKFESGNFGKTLKMILLK